MIFENAVESLEGLFNEGKYDELEVLCEKILEIQSSNPSGLYYKAKLLESKGELKGVAEIFTKLALIFPYNEHYRALVEESKFIDINDFNDKYSIAKKSIVGFSNRPSLGEYETVLGKFTLPLHPSNDQIAKRIIRGDIFEPEIVEVAKKYIRPGTAVLDLGANFGQMSVLFSNLVGESGMVYSFEADDYLHHIIKRNIELNSISNIKPFCAAVHERSGEKVFFPEQDFIQWHCYGAYGLNPDLKEGRSVETITIDSLNIDREISFMKVDVQGADLFAMRGAIETINNYRFPIIFEYEEQFQERFGTSFQDYVDFVASIKYKFAFTVNYFNYVIVPEESLL